MEQTGSRFREIVASALKVGVATFASLLGWVVGGKILALQLGPAGVGIFGLLRQLLQNLILIATFNGTTALVQGLASRTGEQRARYRASVGRLFAIGGGSVALVLLAGSPWLGPLLVPDPHAATLVRWLALAVIVGTANAYYTGLLNAERAVNALVRSQLLGPVVVLVLAYPMAKLVQHGQPIGLVVMLMAPGAAVALGAMLRSRSIAPAPARSGIERRDAAAFFGMSAVVLVCGLMSTASQYLLSRFVAARLGLEQAGMFWVAWTLSMSYVTLVLGSYGTYYMPALSALQDPTRRRALIRDYLRLALLFMPVLVSGVIAMKPLIIRVMFSTSMLPAVKTMRWMLIGDFLKGIAWVLAFPMIAFNEMRWFFWTELAFFLGLAGAGWAWLAGGGSVEGLGALFLFLYATYLVTMCFYVGSQHGFRFRPGEVARFGAGLALVLVSSSLTWDAVEVAPGRVALVGLLCCAFLAHGLFGARLNFRKAPVALEK